jgi:hypothetical protein
MSVSLPAGEFKGVMKGRPIRNLYFNSAMNRSSFGAARVPRFCSR